MDFHQNSNDMHQNSNDMHQNTLKGLRLGVLGVGEVGKNTAKVLARSSQRPVALFDKNPESTFCVSGEINSTPSDETINLSRSICCADLASFCANTDVIFVCVETCILREVPVPNVSEVLSDSSHTEVSSVSERQQELKQELHFDLEFPSLLAQLKLNELEESPDFEQMGAQESKKLQQFVVDEVMRSEIGTYDTRNICQLMNKLVSQIQRLVDNSRNDIRKKFLVFRSTMLPGTTELVDKLYGSCFHSFVWPEFLSRDTADIDTCGINDQTIILGHGSSVSCSAQMYMRDLFTSIFSNNSRCRVPSSLSPSSSPVNVWCLPSREVECIKLFGNAFYAEKLRFFQRAHTLCSKINISYDLVRLGLLTKCFVSPAHTQVPGSDGITDGASGPCLSKDHQAFLALEDALEDV